MLQTEMPWRLLELGPALCKCRGWKASGVIHEKCRRKDKTSREKWNRGIRTAVPTKCWQRLENVFVLFPGTHKCKCVLCHHAGLIPSLSPGTRYARWHRALEWDWQCVARVWARRPTGRPGTTIWHEGTPWLARCACGTCQGFGSQEFLLLLCKGRGGGTTVVLHLADTLEDIYSTVYYQFLLQMERKHAATHSKVWRGNYACWLCYFHHLSCSWFSHACKISLGPLWCSLNQKQPICLSFKDNLINCTLTTSAS